MSLVRLAVGEFALPVPRIGSIESHSGFGRSLDAGELGQAIHREVQERRSRQDSSYRAEVSVSREFERGGYRFLIGGRLDGIFESEASPRIEEIKTSFAARELARRFGESPETHPYCLQLRTYGFFHWLERGTEPKLSFHVVSIRNGEWFDVALELDRAGYENWLDRRLDELVREARQQEKRARRRSKMAEAFSFPFERPRPGQVELIERIEDGVKRRARMLIQAPTGLGKTAGVLYPALKEALSRGQRVIYVTPKNSQHSVAEDAVARFQGSGTPVKSLTITAKSKICFKNEPLCNPEYCEYARDYYTKVEQKGLREIIARKKKLNARVFRALGEEHEVCPFELQLEASREADTVICDYNYVFAPRTAFGRISESDIGQTGKPNLVIDEAHNLPARAMDYYSPSLSSAALEKMRSDLRSLPRRFQAEAETLLDGCIQTLISCRPPEGAASRIDPPAEAFLAQEAELRSFLSRYLEADMEIQPRDVVLRLCFYWSEFASALGFVSEPKRPEFFTTYHPHPTGGMVRITCCDASPMLEECYEAYEGVVAFSATLKPFDYYARLSGLEPGVVETAEFQSPFPKRNRKLLIIPQVSTKYSDRERNYPRIADAIRRIASLRAGNYFAFFPSFDFLSRTLECFEAPEGFMALRQEREMKAADVEAVLEHLRERKAPTIVFAVQGGVFSEGVDYPGETVIGAFVVGPPLPSFDLEREKMREYYEERYGAGFDFAYTYPAMAKAVQAAGRVIRSENDRGIVVLMDNRFVLSGYAKSMPADWFERGPGDLVSAAILKDVANFWEAVE